LRKLPTGCTQLDELLGGGFEPATIIQLYGGSASGKTNICLQLALRTAESGDRVIYIDTEGFSAERFAQIGRLEEIGEDAFKQLAKRIIIFEPATFEEQYQAVRDCERLLSQGVTLLIVDSVSSFYRLGLEDSEGIRLKRELASQVALLLGYARKHDLVVVITNQVYTDIETDENVPLGGTVLAHLSKVIVELTSTGPNRRKATLRKHRSRPEGLSCDFELYQEGIR